MHQRKNLRFVHGNTTDGRPSDEARRAVRSHAAVGGWINIYKNLLSRPDPPVRIPRRRAARSDAPEVSTLRLTRKFAGTVIGYRSVGGVVQAVHEWLDENQYQLWLQGDHVVRHALPQAFAASQVDPFDSLPLPNDPFVNMLLFNFFKRWVIDFPEVGAPATPNAGTVTNWSVMQQNPAALTTHIFLSAVVLYIVSGLDTSTPAILQFKNLALRLVNRAIADSDCTDAILIAISAMCISESFLGGIQEIEVHKTGMKNLIALRGGFDTLRPYTRRLLIFHDKSIASMCRIPRSFPQHGHEDLFQTATTYTQMDDTIVLREGFTPLINDGTIHQTVVNPLRQFQFVLHKILAVYPSQQWKDVVSYDEWNEVQASLEVITVTTLLLRLNNFTFAKPYDISECARLAALRLCYFVRVWCCPGYQLPPDLMDEIVTSVVAHVEDVVQHPRIDILLSIDEARAFWWILCTIGCCTPDPRLLGVLDFFKTRLDIKTPETSINVLEKFLFPYHLLQAQYALFWNWLNVEDFP